MKFILTYESYLKGGRQPLYHFTYGRLGGIMDSDILKPGISIIDKYGNRGRGEKVTKSVSLTRNPSLGSHGDIRIVLNTDRLKQDGYNPYPLDELGMAARSRGKSPSDWTRKPWMHTKVKTQHNLDLHKKYDYRSDWELEFEERIDGEIKNLGKYIDRIDFSEEKWERKNIETIIEYIKKYPHIQIGIADTKEVMIGNSKKQVFKQEPKEIVLDIDKVRKREKELVSQ